MGSEEQSPDETQAAGREAHTAAEEHDHPADRDPERGEAGHGSATLGDRYASEMLQVMEAVRERFGTTDPPEDALRLFLREWLASQGRSEDEIDEIMRRV